MPPANARSPIRWKHGYVWVTFALFAIAATGHWIAGWYVHVSEARTEGRTPEVRDYALEMVRDTLENWQSEFLQLIWQVAGLAFLFFVGSPQSKEGDERVEAKLDVLLEQVEGGAARGRDIDRRFRRSDAS